MEALTSCLLDKTRDSAASGGTAKGPHVESPWSAKRSCITDVINYRYLRDLLCNLTH